MDQDMEPPAVVVWQSLSPPSQDKTSTTHQHTQDSSNTLNMNKKSPAPVHTLWFEDSGQMETNVSKRTRKIHTKPATTPQASAPMRPEIDTFSANQQKMKKIIDVQFNIKNEKGMDNVKTVEKR